MSPLEFKEKAKAPVPLLSSRPIISSPHFVLQDTVSLSLLSEGTLRFYCFPTADLDTSRLTFRVHGLTSLEVALFSTNKRPQCQMTKSWVSRPLIFFTLWRKRGKWNSCQVASYAETDLGCNKGNHAVLAAQVLTPGVTTEGLSSRHCIAWKARPFLLPYHYFIVDHGSKYHHRCFLPVMEKFAVASQAVTSVLGACYPTEAVSCLRTLQPVDSWRRDLNRQPFKL